MFRTTFRSIFLATTALALPSAATAQDSFLNGVYIQDFDDGTADLFVLGNTVLDEKVCIGDGCNSVETFDTLTLLKMKYSLPNIDFIDTSGDNFPNRNWRLLANDGGSIANGGLERFSIQDLDAGTTPFTVEGDAPSNALWINDDGDVGLGTSLPRQKLHVFDTYNPTLRLEQPDTVFPAQAWDLAGTFQGLYIIDDTTNRIPVKIGAASPNDSFVVAANGNVGFGTATPQAPFEVSDDETYTFFRITAEQAPINQSVDITFTQGPLGTGEMRYNIVDDDGPEMRLNADGDMVIYGSLTTAGSLCKEGCDAVFDADFKRRSILEHAELMWEKRHLPAVGPTIPGEPVNVTEKMASMLNELEHAHIYIEELHGQTKEQAEHIAALTAGLEAQADMLRAQQAELDALKAMIAD